jgi:hypothetical protein
VEDAGVPGIVAYTVQCNSEEYALGHVSRDASASPPLASSLPASLLNSLGTHAAVRALRPAVPPSARVCLSAYTPCLSLTRARPRSTLAYQADLATRRVVRSALLCTFELARRAGCPHCQRAALVAVRYGLCSNTTGAVTWSCPATVLRIL